MRTTWLLAAAAVVSFSLAAQTTGRISGTVLDTAGKPVRNPAMTMKRIDLNTTRTIRIESNGSFFQVGLGPYEYEVVVTAEGYVEHRERLKIGVDNLSTLNIVLKTVGEAQTAASGGAEAAAANMKANTAVEVFNQAIKIFDQNKYAEAIDGFESALEAFSESLAAAADPTSKGEIEKNLAKTLKMLAVCRYEVGKADRARRSELWALAEPALKDDFEQAPQDAYVAQALADISGMKGDKKAESTYLEIVDKLIGPQVGNSYNRAVDFFNEGNYAEAKVHLKKAIEIDPKLPDSYYLLAICEYSSGDMKAAKSLLERYLQIDPKGRYADTVREMLTDPSLK